VYYQVGLALSLLWSINPEEKEKEEGEDNRENNEGKCGERGRRREKEGRRSFSFSFLF
jgi:hypothetical protein